MNRVARAVIFDYDGTLVDTAEAFLESINTALGNAHLRNTTRREISSMDLREIIRNRVREMRGSKSVEQIFDSIWEAFADRDSENSNRCELCCMKGAQPSKVASKLLENS